MALFVTVESAVVNVQALNQITLNGPGNLPIAATGQDVGVWGQLTATSGVITSCTITSTGGNLIVNPSCAITGGSGTPTASYSGSFTVGNVAPGQYLITVTGSSGSGATAQATLIVRSGPKIFLVPSKGPIGTHIQITGTFFQPGDTSCTISSSSSGSVIASGSAGCSTFSVPVSSTNSSYLEQNVTGSFVVGNVAEGQYVIQVSGNTGDFAQAVLNVTAGAFIQLGVNGIFAPLGQAASGPSGAHVSVTGSGFLPQDANSGTCTLSSTSSGSVIASGSAACSFFKASNGFANVTGSFVVGNVAEGQYVIQVTGSAGDRAQAIFNVTAGAFIQLGVNGIVAPLGLPASGPSGVHVTIEGSHFLPQDANSGTCTISSTSSGSVIASGSAACSFFKAPTGFVNVTGSFVVGNVAEGQYVIQVTGNGGDRAQAVFNVTAGAFIQLSGLNGGFASLGQVASGPSGLHVSVVGSNWLPQDANSGTCTISSTSSGAVIASGSAACSFFKAPNGFVNATGSFVVGNVFPGQYVIQVSGSAGDFAQAVFNVTRGAFIQLGVNNIFVPLGQVASGPIGTHVSFEGSNFLPSDTSCTVSSTTGAIVIGGACSTFNAPNGFKNVTGSFTVGNVLPGQYVIQVSGNGGDFAQAVFNVTIGARLSLSPGSGRIGTHVLVNGTGFLPTDSLCTLSSPSSGAFILGGSAAIAIQVGTGRPGGSFTVGNVAPGQYLVQVSCNQGDLAQAVFNVTLGPKLSLSPGTGAIGTHVLVNGTGFLPTDNTCTISGPGSAIVLAAGCSIQAGTGTPGGSFTVGNVVPGQYVIQVTGNGGDFAQAVFNVTMGAVIVLTPSIGPPGADIHFLGSGFLPTDTSCVVSSPGSDAVLLGSGACAIQAGKGIVNGSFLVGNALPGQYVIQVTGNGGDFAQAVLTVENGPRLSLSPGTGRIGDEILVNGTGFLPTDTSCTLISGSSNLFNPILAGSGAVAIAVGTGVVNGSFVIGNVPPGQYVLQVTCNQGDSAQAVVRVIGGLPSVQLFPINAPTGATVTVIAYGLNPSDTGCYLVAYNAATNAPSNSLMTGSSTCSITSPQTAQGSFVVGPYATQNIPYNVTVVGTPANDFNGAYSGLPSWARFNVTASVYVTPPTGSRGSVFTYTGSGFESDATSCTAATIPSIGTPSCFISSGIGQIAGSITAPAGAPSGTYAVVVTDNTGASASGFFTVGTPSALLVLNPSSVQQSQPVGVAGTGFNPDDSSCTITAGGTPPWSGPGGTAPVCSIAGGYASGSFTVSNTASGGYYLITITGNSGDFAQNFLAVELQSTVTTYSTTSTTKTSSTTSSTTTTSMATSYSYSSTSTTLTGIWYSTFTHVTLTTLSAPTTTSLTSTTTTTEPHTTVIVTLTTSYSTVSCGPLPCGFAIRSQGINQSVPLGPFADNVGLLAVLLLLIPMLLRRLFS
ncbi:MAG TPA: hypothetical protein VMU35_02200 [Methylomirabilota bacterium]|nr:hypothetical protein [Methylomirabilota bacterium]